MKHVRVLSLSARILGGVTKLLSELNFLLWSVIFFSLSLFKKKSKLLHIFSFSETAICFHLSSFKATLNDSCRESLHLHLTWIVTWQIFFYPYHFFKGLHLDLRLPITIHPHKNLTSLLDGTSCENLLDKFTVLWGTGKWLDWAEWDSSWFHASTYSFGFDQTAALSICNFVNFYRAWKFSRVFYCL